MGQVSPLIFPSSRRPYLLALQGELVLLLLFGYFLNLSGPPAKHRWFHPRWPYGVGRLALFGHLSIHIAVSGGSSYSNFAGIDDCLYHEQ